MAARYHPEVFNVASVEHAKSIILTNEGPGDETETRWQLETPYVLELVNSAVGLRPEMVVLDYGCGIGRMAKAMIDACGCSVIGVDISPTMRALASEYVGSDRFIAISPGQFDILVRAGLRVNAAIAVWVLQHCFAPAVDIARIGGSLVADGSVFVVNMKRRCVPAVVDGASADDGFVWAADGIDVAMLLSAAFRVAAEGALDPVRTPKMAAAGTFWMSLRRGADFVANT
jgi:SAM-dependent methyltransferase